MPNKSRPTNLPDYRRPPVSEVAISIQFATLEGLHSSHVGLFWSQVRRNYPKISEHQPLEPSFETFGITPTLREPAIKIEQFLTPPMPRYWFERADGIELFQLQQNRIFHNWRKLKPGQQYVHYEAIREKFESEVLEFSNFLRKEKLGRIQPNQCEVTYTNHISLPEGSNPHEQLAKITPLWSGKTNTRFLPTAEFTAVQTRYVLSEKDKPFGRVYIVFSPGLLAADNRPVVRLEITVRGKPEGKTVPAAFRLLDKARKVVVKSFTDVTVPELHSAWERFQ